VAQKQRLDKLLVERDLVKDVETARIYIDAGLVAVDGNFSCKAGSLYDNNCQIRLKQRKQYVSRGGEKLVAGLEGFDFDVNGLICADIGCSTGGFTDCLLQRGAARVYCVDVGYGVLDWKLRQDSRVVVLERTNARFISRKEIPDPLDFAVIDVSFISLNLLLDPVYRLFAEPVRMIVLVKPQFELPKEKVGAGGIVTETRLHDEALAMVRGYAAETGLKCEGIIASPIHGAKGNQEFLMYLRRL